MNESQPISSYGRFRRKVSVGMATLYLASQFLPFAQVLASPDLISRPGAGSSRIPLQVMNFNAPGFGDIGDAVNLANGNLFLDAGAVTRNTTLTNKDASTDPDSKMIGNWTTKSRLKLVNSQSIPFDQNKDLTSDLFANLSGQPLDLYLETGDASKSRFVPVTKAELPSNAPSWIKDRYINYPNSQVLFYRLAADIALQTTDEWIVVVRDSQGTYAHYYDHSGNRSTFHKDGPYLDYQQTLNQQYHGATATLEDPEGDRQPGTRKTEITYDTTNKDLIKEIRDEWGRKTVYTWNTDKTLKTVEYKYNGTITTRQVDFTYTNAYGAGNVIDTITYKTWSGKGAALSLDSSRTFNFAYKKQDIIGTNGNVVGNQAVISSITRSLIKNTNTLGQAPTTQNIESKTTYSYSTINGSSLAVTGVTQTGEKPINYNYEPGKSLIAGGMKVTVTQGEVANGTPEVGSSVMEFHYDTDSRLRKRRVKDNQTSTDLKAITTQFNDFREWRYEYYPSGLLAIEVDPAGKVTHYAYDSRGNLIRKTAHKDSTNFDFNTKPIEVKLTSSAGSFNTGSYATFKGSVLNDPTNQGVKYDLTLSQPMLGMPSEAVFAGGNYWRVFQPSPSSTTPTQWLSDPMVLQDRYAVDLDGLPYITLQNNEQLKRLNAYLSPGTYKLSFKIRSKGVSTDPAGNLTLKVDTHTKDLAFPSTTNGTWLPQEFVFHKKLWSGELSFLTNQKVDLKDIALTPVFNLSNQIGTTDVGHTDSFAWYPYLELGKNSTTTSPKTFLSNTGTDPTTRQGGTINVASYDSGTATTPAASGLYFNQWAPAGKYRVSFEAQLDPADPNTATALDVYYGIGLRSTWAEYQKVTLSGSWQKFESVLNTSANNSTFGILENTPSNHAWQIRNLKVEYLDGVTLYLPWGTSSYEANIKATSVADPSASISVNYPVNPKVQSLTTTVAESHTPSTPAAKAIQFAVPAPVNNYVTAPKFTFQATLPADLPSGTNKSVTWVTNATRDGGAVSSTGVFTAPAWSKTLAGTSPIYDVTAISIDNPDVSYTLKIQVKYFNVELMTNPGIVRASVLDRNCAWFFGNCIFKGWIETETYYYQLRTRVVNLPPPDPQTGVWWMPSFNWTSKLSDGKVQPISKNGCSRIPVINWYDNPNGTGYYSVDFSSNAGNSSTTFAFHIGQEYPSTACDAPMDTPGTHFGVEYIENNEVMKSGLWQYVLRDKNPAYADYTSGSLHIKSVCEVTGTNCSGGTIIKQFNGGYSLLIQSTASPALPAVTTLSTDQGSIQFFDDSERAGWVTKDEFKYNNDNQLLKAIHHTSSAVGTSNGLTPTTEQGKYNDQVTEITYTLRDVVKETFLKQTFADTQSIKLQQYDLADATLASATPTSVRSTLTTTFTSKGLVDTEALTAGSTTRTTTYQYPTSASSALVYRNGSTLNQSRSVTQLFDRPQKVTVASGSDSTVKTLIYDEFGNVGSELTWSAVVTNVTAAGATTSSNLEKRNLYNGFGQLVWTGSLISGALDYASESYNNYDSNGQLISSWSGVPTNQTVYHYSSLGVLKGIARGTGGTDDYLATAAQFTQRESTEYTLEKVDYGRITKERRNWWKTDKYITRTYDTLNRVIKEIQPDGNGFERQYDAFGTLSEVTLDSTGTAIIARTWTRNTLGQVTSEKMEELSGGKRTNTTYYLYDFEGRVLQSSQSNSPYHATAADSTSYTLYDSWGNVLWELGPKLKTTGIPVDSSRRTLVTYTYDELNRKTGETRLLEGANSGTTGLTTWLVNQPAEYKATTIYSQPGLGLVKETIDPMGYKTTTSFDRMGNLYKTTRELWLSTDAADLPGKVTGDTATTMSAFNAAGQATIKRDPTGKLVYTKYDKLGNGVLQSDFTGNVIEVKTYTPDGLLKTVKVPKTDGTGWLLINNWDSTDLLVRDDKFVTVEAYEYVGYGVNPSKVFKANMDNTPDGNGSTVTGGVSTRFEYNHQGKPTLTTLPDSRTLEQNFDHNGNVTYSKSPEGFETLFTYDAFGSLIRKEERARVQYNTDGTVKKDASGNPIAVNSDVKTDIEANLTAPLVSTYVYDLAGRVTEKTERGITTNYEYNALGNVVRESRSHKSTLTSGFPYKQYRYRLDGQKVLETSFTYTASVNPAFDKPVLCAPGLNAASGTSGNQHVWEYDQMGRVVTECSDGKDSAGVLRQEFKSSYAYDGLGQRVKRVFNGDAEIYSSYEFDPTINTLISVDKSNARSQYNTYWRYDKRGLLQESFDYLSSNSVNGSIDAKLKFNAFTYQYNDNGQETLASRNAQVTIKAPLRLDPAAPDKDQYKPAAAILAASVGSIETKYNERGLIRETVVLDQSPKVAKDSNEDAGLELNRLAQQTTYTYYLAGQTRRVTVKRDSLIPGQNTPTYPVSVGTKEYTEYDSLGRVKTLVDSNGANEDQPYSDQPVRFAGSTTITTEYSASGGTTTQAKPAEGSCTYREVTTTTVGGLVHQVKTTKSGCQNNTGETKTVTNRYTAEGLPTGSLMTVSGDETTQEKTSVSAGSRPCEGNTSGCYQERREYRVSCTGTFTGSDCSSYKPISEGFTWIETCVSTCKGSGTITWDQNPDGSPTGSGTVKSISPPFQPLEQDKLITSSFSYSSQVDSVLTLDNYLNTSNTTETSNQYTNSVYTIEDVGTPRPGSLPTGLVVGPPPCDGCMGTGGPTNSSSNTTTKRNLTSTYNDKEGYLLSESGTETKEEGEGTLKKVTTKQLGKSFILDSRGNRIKFNSTVDQGYEFNNYKKRYDADGRISVFYLRKDLQDVWNHFLYDAKGNQILSSTGGLFQRKVPSDPSFTESYVKRNFTSTHFAGNQVQMYRHREGDFGFKYNYTNAVTFLWFTLRPAYGELTPNNTYEKTADARYQQIKDDTFTLADGVNDRVDWSGVQASPFDVQEGTGETNEPDEVLPEAILNVVAPMDVRPVDPILPVDGAEGITKSSSQPKPSSSKPAKVEDKPEKAEQGVSSPEITTFKQGISAAPVASTPKQQPAGEEKTVGSAPAPKANASGNNPVSVQDTTIKGTGEDDEPASVLPDTVESAGSGVVAQEANGITQTIDPVVLTGSEPQLPALGVGPSDAPGQIKPSNSPQPDHSTDQKIPESNHHHRSSLENQMDHVSIYELIQVLSSQDHGYLEWLVTAANDLDMKVDFNRLKAELAASNFDYVNSILESVIRNKIKNVYGYKGSDELRHFENVLKSASYSNSTSVEKFTWLADIAYNAYMFLGGSGSKPDEKSKKTFSTIINNMDWYINTRKMPISKAMSQSGIGLKIDSVMMRATVDVLYWYMQGGGGWWGRDQALAKIQGHYPYMERLTSQEFIENIDWQIGIDVVFVGVAFIDGAWIILAVREGIILAIPYTVAAAQRFGPRVQNSLANLTSKISGPRPEKWNLFSESDPLHERFGKTTTPSGTLDIGMHGGPNSVKPYLSEEGSDFFMTVDDFAVYLQGNFDLSKYSCIRLVSCSTGKQSDGFAQRLANLLQKNVVAPDSSVWINKNGELSIHPRMLWPDGEGGVTNLPFPNTNINGNWVEFTFK